MANRKPTKSMIVEYLKDQFFSSYEGEWEDLLEEINRYYDNGQGE